MIRSGNISITLNDLLFGALKIIQPMSVNVGIAIETKPLYKDLKSDLYSVDKCNNQVYLIIKATYHRRVFTQGELPTVMHSS